MAPRAIVSAARNESYTIRSLSIAVQQLLDSLEPQLASRIKRGDRVLVKVNMGCSGAREPDQRMTSHPAYVEAIIRTLLDCGARVSFGDDVARAGKYCESIYQRTGMRDVANRTGADLIDFVAVGGREVRGGLFVPRTYFVTNAYFEADLVINAANCRSHVGIDLSGAMKNMFGCVIGLRKRQIHNLFPGQPRAFGRAIADVYRTIQPDLSFLDLTTVVGGAGQGYEITPVGLMLAGTDAVALDTVAAHTIGYSDLRLWIAYYGNSFGLGCNQLDQIAIRGIDWERFHKPTVKHPWVSTFDPSVYDHITAVVNNSLLRPRPAISPGICTSCGDCARRCPADCIAPVATDGPYRIDLAKCVDCGCCLNVCDAGAIGLKYVGIAKLIRQLVNRLPDTVDVRAPNPFDPAV